MSRSSISRKLRLLFPLNLPIPKSTSFQPLPTPIPHLPDLPPCHAMRDAERRYDDASKVCEPILRNTKPAEFAMMLGEREVGSVANVETSKENENAGDEEEGEWDAAEDSYD